MPEPITLTTVPQFERNLSHPVATDKSFVITARNLDGVTPTNITGWAISFIVHLYGDPRIVYITRTVGSGVTITNGPQGEFTVSVTATNLGDMLPGLYQWRAERTDSGSDFVLGKGSYSLLAK